MKERNIYSLITIAVVCLIGAYIIFNISAEITGQLSGFFIALISTIVIAIGFFKMLE